MKRFLALLLCVVTLMSFCVITASAATDPKGEADFVAYRLATQPKLDGVISAGEYYLLADSSSFTSGNSTKAIYAGYDDEYLYLAAKIACKGHVNSWYYTENGATNVDGRDIYDGHSMTIGLISESPKSGDQVKAFVSKGDTSWLAGYESCIARLFHLALTDNYYRYKLESDYAWFGTDGTDWSKWKFNSYYNALGCDYQLSGVGYSHVASTAAPSGGTSDDLVYVDEKTGGAIQYNTANIAEDSYRSEKINPQTYYSQKLFIVSHNGFTGLNIHDGKSTYDEKTGKYAHVMKGDAESYYYSGYGDESVNNGSDLDVYEMYIPWKWIDYRTSSKRKDELSDKNTEDYSKFAVLNTRQQQLTGKRTTDGSLYYLSDKHTNSATEDCAKTVDGTYFGLYVDLRTGGDASKLKQYNKDEYSAMSAEEQKAFWKAFCAEWCKYYEDFYTNKLAEDNTLGSSQSDLGNYKTIYLAGNPDADAKPSEATGEAPATSGDTTTTTTTTTTASEGSSATTTASGSSTANTTKSGSSANNKTPTTATKTSQSAETGDGTVVAVAAALLAGIAVIVISKKRRRV